MKVEIKIHGIEVKDRLERRQVMERVMAAVQVPFEHAEIGDLPKDGE